MATDQDEKIGYGRPPKHSRFQPGRSGNPAGRKKGERNVATALAAELRTTITVRENGSDQRVSKAEAMAKALVMKALKGDAKAFAQIMALLPDQFRLSDQVRSNSDITASERSALERFISRKFHERTVAAEKVDSVANIEEENQK